MRVFGVRIMPGILLEYKPTFTSGSLSILCICMSPETKYWPGTKILVKSICGST